MGVWGAHDFGEEHARNLNIARVNRLATGLGVSVNAAYASFPDMVIGDFRNVCLDIVHAFILQVFIGSYPELAHGLNPSLFFQRLSGF